MYPTTMFSGKGKSVSDIPLGKIDYLLVYPKNHNDGTSSDTGTSDGTLARKKFLAHIIDQGANVAVATLGNHVYLKVRIQFSKLCTEAEHSNLHMPLKDVG